MNKLPPLKSMQVFEVTARHLSFSRAASELCVSQSAVSHQIKSLEKFLGQQLLIRNNSSVSLTSEGDTFYSVIKDCFTRMKMITNHLVGESELRLKVMAQTSIAVEYLAPRMASFKKENPGIEIDLFMSSLDTDFDHSNYDIILGTWPVPQNFVTQKIRDEKWYPVCSKAQSKLVNVNDPLSLLKQPLISSEKGQDWDLWAQYQKINTTEKLDVQNVSHTLLAAKAVLGGQGIALSCDFIAADMINEGQLIAIKNLEYTLPWGNYNIHYRIGSHSTDKIEAFAHWLLKTSNNEL